MNLTKKRWMVLIASCLINLCIGALYAWSVFSSGMAEYLSSVNHSVITTSSLAIVFSIANTVGPITMIGGGKLVRSIGPRWIITMGGVCFGLGMIISGFAQSVGMLILGFGLCCGLAMGMTYGCTVSNCVKFFPDKRGLVGGITTASYGLSSVIVPIIANKIMEETSVTMAFKCIGIAVVVIVCVASIWVIPCPDDFVPEGYKPLVEKSNSNVKNYTWKEMLKTPSFYIMILMMCSGAFMGMMIISQASPIAQKQVMLSSATASLVVSILALFNTGGRIVGGIISDKIGQVNTLILLLLSSIVGLFLLVITKEGSLVTFLLGVCIIGLCFGGFMGIYPGFTNERFGAKYSSVNYGIMFIGFAVSGFAAPMMIGKLYTSTNSYVPAYYVAMVLSFVSILLAFLYKKVEKQS